MSLPGATVGMSDRGHTNSSLDISRYEQHEGERKESARDETPETVLHPQHILCYLCIKQLLYVNMYVKAIMILSTYI